ncbi:transposase [Mycobacterium frederiksbergense]|uniref:Transposase n=1 Tax=Mycolicibacterium frederiksbergense TaxID=117567 RepID=A0ABT6KZX0_9MYCO|nr:transposase [Mycolicibacterium frederiksbergense]
MPTDQIAAACFTQARTAGDVSLVLYDVTTLYFEADKEDELRKVGYSKERRVDPQIVVGLLIVADAGMLSSTNLRDLYEAGLRFIVGSRVTKAPNDLQSHFRWRGTCNHRRSGHRHDHPTRSARHSRQDQ